MMKKTGLVFVLFLIGLPTISAVPDCCQTMKVEIQRKWQTYQTLCNGNNCEGYAFLFKGATSDYVIIKDDRVSPSAAITVCVWLKTTQIGRGHLFSYAIPGATNHFLIQFFNNNLRFDIVGSSSRQHDIKINDGKWHHVCLTWKSDDGHYEIYKDGKSAGNGSISSGRKLSHGGIWVLGQDQDSLGGGFELIQAFAGEMTEANIWDKVVSAQEILEMSKSCISASKGNVVSWNEFKSGVKGNVKIVKPACCSIFVI